MSNQLTLSITPKRAGNKVDYLPFGIKTLKVIVDGEYNGKLCLAPCRLASNAEAGEKFGHEDQGTPPQFVVFWGGGHEDYYLLDYYPKKRVVYFFVYHAGQAPLRDHLLTIKAWPEGGDKEEAMAELKVTLTVPLKVGDAFAAEELVKPQWKEVSTGLYGASDIILEGGYVPDYISRWWPYNRVLYPDVGEPPQVRLHYKRLVNEPNVDEDCGTLEVHVTHPSTGQEVPLAKIQGRIPYPLYDMKQVVPELYRFGSQTWALRVWFLWLDKELSLQDLSRYGTRTQQEIKQAWRGITAKSESPHGEAEETWDERHEIPDGERVDIIFNHDLERLYAATDLHWREMWGRCDDKDKAVHVQILNARLKRELPEWQTAREFAEGLFKIGWAEFVRRLPWKQKRGYEKPYNPYEAVKEDLKQKGKLGAGVERESHTPGFLNVTILSWLVSTDVTDG